MDTLARRGLGMPQAKSEAVIYARSSAGEVKDPEEVLAEQINECLRYAREHDLVIAKIFVDVASGSLKHRPGLRSLTEYLRSRSPAVSAVITVEKSRVARSLYDYMMVWEGFTSLGAGIILTTDERAFHSYL